MFPKFSPSIVERLSEPVIALGTGGEITGFNAAARPVLRHFLLNQTNIRRDLAIAASSKSGLPRLLTSIPRVECAGVQREAWLCECGNALGVVFLPSAPSVAAVQANSPQDGGAAFYLLLNAEVRQEFASLRERLEAFAASHPESCAELVQPALRFGGLLSVLELLSTVLQTPVGAQMERLAMRDLLHDVLSQAPGVNMACLNVELSDEVQGQGAVYGRSEWLRVALQALVDALAEDVSPDSDVELRLRQNGNFLVLTGRHGAAQGCRKGLRKPADQSAPCFAQERAPVLRVEPSMRQAVARLIVDFHGGLLRFQRSHSSAQAAGVDAFTLELPTGIAQRECSAAARAQCIYPAQARALAQDLAQMLPKSAPEAVLSLGEVSLLNELVRGLAQR